MNNQETIENEFKREINEKTWLSWCKTIVAFSNTQGGKIMFGYDDDGTFVGIDNRILDEKIRHIEQIIRSHVEPFPIYTISDYHTVDDKTAFTLFVKQRPNTVTWLLNNDNPIMYVRREKMTVPSTIEELERAILEAHTNEYDLTKVGVIANLRYFTKLNEYYKRANDGLGLTDNDLISLNLSSQDQFLTITGLMFSDFSNYRNANAVCNTWPETTKGSNRVIDSKTIHGSALQLFEFMMDYIRSVQYYSFGGVKNGIYFYDDGSYSTIALREAIINSIAHRDYKIVGSEIVVDCYPDRIEITSPGSMLQYKNGANNVELEVLPSFRRNPNICRVFVKCKLMEEKGSGFAKIIEDYKKLSEVYKPTCSFNYKTFAVCLKNKKYQYPIDDVIDTPMTNLNDYLINKDMFKSRSQIYEEKPRVKSIEELIKQNPNISYEQIQSEFNISRDGVKYYIRLLKEACLIRRRGSNLSGYYEIVNDIDRPSQFLNLDSDVQSLVLKWCKEHFIPTKSFNDKHTSYGLKHILQHQNGTYLTNGQFKGAMILSGFRVKSVEDLNWVFNISEQSAALKLKID